MDKEIIAKVVKATVLHKNDEKLKDLGKKMFDMYTASGLPPDMFIEKIKEQYGLSESQVIFVISEYQRHFIEHRRLSGLNEKRIEAIRRKNREDIKSYIKTGELSIY